MRRKPNPEIADTENPEWTEETFAKARRASEVLPELYDTKAAAQMLRPRGRPKARQTKQLVSLRLSQEVLEHFRTGGRGWQTRIDQALRKAAGI